MTARFRRPIVTGHCFIIFATILSAAQSGSSEHWQQKVRTANAAVLILDVTSGQPLLQSGDLDRKSAPGSVLKPFVLITALQSGAIREHETVACRGSFPVRGHNLACSHPRDITILDARQALASSCNTYFATLAQRMPNATLTAGLQKFGIAPTSLPQSGDDRALLALGLQGVSANTRQLGTAYVRLAQQMNAQHDASSAAVHDGLLQSVATGMAHRAWMKDITLGGKTGTVDDTGGRSHGWFAGIVYVDASTSVVQKVIIVFVPDGNGADAASLAKLVLSERHGLR